MKGEFERRCSTPIGSEGERISSLNRRRLCSPGVLFDRSRREGYSAAVCTVYVREEGDNLNGHNCYTIIPFFLLVSCFN